MPVENKVPKGIFDSAIQFYGINIEQLFIISFVAIVFAALGFIFKAYTLYILILDCLVNVIMYYVFRISNYHHRGALFEKLAYSLKYSKGTKRYSGRCRNFF